MSVGRGIMQMGRINVYPTTTTIINVTPPAGTAVCGDLVTFSVEVDGYVAPDGYVVVQNIMDGYVVGVGRLVPSSGPESTTTISAHLSNGVGNYVAFYPYPSVLNPQIDRDGYGKVLKSFGNSRSLALAYNVGFNATTTTITTSPGTYFCYHQDFSVTAFVMIGGSPVIDGYVDFRLYHNDGYTFDSLGSGQLDITGHASVIVPANSTIALNDYYVQATYLGSGCAARSATPTGIDGTLVHSIRLDTTTPSVPVLLGSNCKSGYVMLTAVVTPTHLSFPSVGSVTFRTTSPLAIVLGSASISDGLVPNTTLGPASSGAVLPQSTISVISTSGFASSGIFYVDTSDGTQAITYSGITGGGSPSFTGCSGGNPGSTLGGTSGAVCAFAVPPGTFTSAVSWSTQVVYNSDGYCYASGTGSLAPIDINNC